MSSENIDFTRLQMCNVVKGVYSTNSHICNFVTSMFAFNVCKQSKNYEELINGKIIRNLRKPSKNQGREREGWGPLGPPFCPRCFYGFLRFGLVFTFINYSEIHFLVAEIKRNIDFTRLQMRDFVK